MPENIPGPGQNYPSSAPTNFAFKRVTVFLCYFWALTCLLMLYTKPPNARIKGTMLCRGRIWCPQPKNLIGRRLFMMDNFPSQRGRENRFLRRKSLKKRTGNCLRNTGIFFISPKVYSFPFGFREIAFDWATTPTNTRENSIFPLVTIDFFCARGVFRTYLINGL